MNTQAAIEALLRERIGLDAGALGPGTVAHAVRRAVRDRGVADASALALLLRRDPAAMQDLVEAVVTRETWFFRDPATFACLVEHARETLRERRDARVRILSVGCATGEEPYSIAIALLEAGVDPNRLHIDAVDVSRRALADARRGVYGEHAFRAGNLAFRDRHFQRTAEGHLLHEEVRAAVRFAYANVVDEPFLPARAPYDAIFFRHVLIYLEPAAGTRALRALGRLLAPRGRLFVGGAECARARKADLVSVGPTAAFAFAPAAAADAPRPGAATPAPTRRPKQPERRPARSPARRRRRPHPPAAARTVSRDHCWNKVGTYGDGSCPELPGRTHCLRCPTHTDYARSYFEREPAADYLRQWARVVAEPKEEPDPGLESMLLFRLGTEWFALPTRRVAEVAAPPAIHRIPYRTGEVLLGLANIMGRLHLCVSLVSLLGLQATPAPREGGRASPRRAVVLQRDDESWAFLADEVHSLQRLDPGQMARPPAAAGAGAYAQGVFDWQGKAVGCLSSDAVFAALARSLR